MALLKNHFLDGTVLLHTCQGDLLRHIEPMDALPFVMPISNLLLSRDGHVAIFYGHERLATFTSLGKQLSPPSAITPSDSGVEEHILCAQLSRDGEYIVIGTESGRISILRLFPMQLLYTYPVSFKN